MSTALAPGDLVRDYRIVRLIAHGGVASTFEVEDTRSGQRFAMKRLSLTLLQEWKQYELFEREARVLASLHHPSIPRYVEHFELELPAGEHAYYLAQELAPGASLAQRVAGGWRCDEAEVRRITVHLLGILRDLQALAPPVFHRDVKPQNVLLAEDGRIFLVDFGAVQDAYRNLTGGSTVVGTYGYMAPEQLRGVALPATDVYGVASTVLFLLTGAPPNELPQRGLRPDFRPHVRCSPALATWLDTALEPDPEKRFRDARAALDFLRGVPATKQKSSRSRAVVLGAIAATLVGAGTAVAGFLMLRPHVATPKAHGASADPPAQLLPRPPSQRYTVMTPPTRVIDAHRGGAHAVAVSPDGLTLSSGGGDGSVKLWNAKTGEPIATLGGSTGRVYFTRFTGDGQRLVSAGGRRLDAWDLKTRDAAYSIDVDPREVGGAGISADGRYLATSGASDHAVKLWDLSTGKPLRTLAPVPGGRGQTIAFSPDGKTVAAAGDDPIIRLWSTDTGALVASCAGHSKAVDAIAFSPDGQTLYSTSDDHTLRAWSMDCRQLVSLGDHSDEVWALAVSPRGDLVATGTKDGWIKLWDTAKLALKYQFEDLTEGTTKLAFLPDGSGFVSAGRDGPVKVWSLPSHTHAQMPTAPTVLDPPTIGTSPSPAQACARASALVDEANGHNVLGEAETLANAALAKDATFAPAYCTLARVALRRGYAGGSKYRPEAIAEANKLVDRAEALAPGSAAVHIARAWVLHSSEDHLGAAREAHAAEEHGPTAAADMLLALENSKAPATQADAERFALRSLAEKPTRGQAWFAYEALEDTYRDDGDYDAASAAYRAQIEVDPDSVWAKGNYAHFLVEIGDYPGATQAAQRALAQMDYGAARSALSMAQSEGGILLLWDYDRPEDARKQFEGALTADPSNATAHYGLAAYWRQLAIVNRDKKALAHFGEELAKAGSGPARQVAAETATVEAWIGSR